MSHSEDLHICHLCQHFGDHETAKCPKLICAHCHEKGHARKDCIRKSKVSAIISGPRRATSSKTAISFIQKSPRVSIAKKKRKKQQKWNANTIIKSIIQLEKDLFDDNQTSQKPESLLEQDYLDIKKVYDLNLDAIQKIKSKFASRHDISDLKRQFGIMKLYFAKTQAKMFVIEKQLFRWKAKPVIERAMDIAKSGKKKIPKIKKQRFEYLFQQFGTFVNAELQLENQKCKLNSMNEPLGEYIRRLNQFEEESLIALEDFSKMIHRLILCGYTDAILDLGLKVVETSNSFVISSESFRLLQDPCIQQPKTTSNIQAMIS